MTARTVVLSLEPDALDTLDRLAKVKASTLDELTSSVMLGYARAHGPRWHEGKPPLPDAGREEESSAATVRARRHAHEAHACSGDTMLQEQR